MAIWQYQLFVLPEEELISYFANVSCITKDAFNEINWWKYRQIEWESFQFFKSILPLKKSWNEDIIMYGNLDSDCIEIILDKGIMSEISIRIDLRHNHQEILKLICSFAFENKCMLVTYDMRILAPILKVMKDDILAYPHFRAFLNNSDD